MSFQNNRVPKLSCMRISSTAICTGSGRHLPLRQSTTALVLCSPNLTETLKELSVNNKKKNHSNKYKAVYTSPLRALVAADTQWAAVTTYRLLISDPAQYVLNCCPSWGRYSNSTIQPNSVRTVSLPFVIWLYAISPPQMDRSGSKVECITSSLGLARVVL